MSLRTERPSARARAHTTAASALLALSTAAAQSPPALDWLDWDALEAGSVEARTGRAGSRIAVSTAALIDAPLDIIWSALKNCEIAPEHVSNVVSCESIEVLDDGRAELFSQTIKPIFFIPRFDHVFRLDYRPPERIDLSGVSGPLEQMQGSWRLLPQPAGSVLVLQDVEVDPAFPAPRFLLRATMRKELTTIMEAVRRVSEEQAAARLDGSSQHGIDPERSASSTR